MDRAQSDDQIVALLATRDERGLATLYDRYGRLVYSLILRIVPGEDVATRLTQEVFLRAWDQAGALEPDSEHLASWLLAIAHHEAISEVRWGESQRQHTSQVSAEGERSRSMLAVSDNTRSDEEHSLGGMRRQSVLTALDRLSPSQRQLLELTYFEGLTQEQITERMLIPLKVVQEATCQALRHIHASFLTGGPGADTL
ncbi:MAG TPA: sigma-70 family RNA polymerase sigma factor [Chloroflexota bacterium]|nr:sigma-70 family RNA polymerase sigma factor [Chloroflexota bacterium]